MKNIITLLLLIVGANFFGYSQDFKFGEIETNDFKREIFYKDADAVVLNEYGEARFQMNDIVGEIQLVFYKHVRVRVDNAEGYKHANISVQLYSEKNRFETITNIVAKTFNLTANGISEVNLNNKDIHTEVVNEYFKNTKFTMPDLKPGSIIEYSYQIITPFYFNLRSWDFQSDLPKVKSEFIAIIPPIYNYNVSLIGSLKLSKSEGVLLPKCIVVFGSEQDCSKMIYTMDNVPPFKIEEHMTSPRNYISSLNFQLEEIIRVGSRQKVTNTWSDVETYFKNNKNFGSQLRTSGLFKSKLPAIIGEETNKLDIAKKIYSFIKSEIKWNNIQSTETTDNLKRAIDNKVGNVADINIALITALKDAGIDAETVILSTRENGFPNKNYPGITDFNYVIAKVEIDKVTYLLDATEPLMPFGMLPLRCLNDQGRVISLKKPSYWIDLATTTYSLSDVNLVGTLNNDGKVLAKLTFSNGGYLGFHRRNYIKSNTSLEDFVNVFNKELENSKITNYSVKNLDSLEEMLIEEYEIEMSLFKGGLESSLVFSPFIINRITKNPYNLSERTFPIDIGWPYTIQHTISLTLPSTYQIEDKLPDLSLAIPENAATYLLRTKIEDNTMILLQATKFGRAVYAPEFYPTLKELYNKIIQSNKGEIFLKKKI